MLSASIVLALLFVVLLLCSCLSDFHPSSASPASSSSLPLSPSVDICGPASAPLLCTPSPLIPIPHTLSVLVLWTAYMCMWALETPPPPHTHTIPTSHLTAYYCSSLRRGLTAGNINRMARSDMRTHANTLCSVESLIPGQLRFAPPPPPRKYCPPFFTMHDYANCLAAARHPLEIVL